MDNKVIIAIVAVAVLVIGGGIAAAFATQFAIDNSNSDCVSYYGNGGHTEDNKDVYEVVNKNVISNVFINEGKVFTGWNTKADGSGKNYDVGDDAHMGLKLYAQWSKYKLTLSDISFMLYGLSFYTADASGNMTKITTFEYALPDDGNFTLYLGGFDSGTEIEISGTDVSGTVYGMNFTLHSKFSPDADISLDGEYVKYVLHYSGNVVYS